jgi:hypothetical protein
VSYALRRGQQWITAPQGLGQPGQAVPPVLAADSDRAAAWVAPTIGKAIERQQLLRMAFGLTTEVRAIR